MSSKNKSKDKNEKKVGKSPEKQKEKPKGIKNKVSSKEEKPEQVKNKVSSKEEKSEQVDQHLKPPIKQPAKDKPKSQDSVKKLKSLDKDDKRTSNETPKESPKQTIKESLKETAKIIETKKRKIVEKEPVKEQMKKIEVIPKMTMMKLQPIKDEPVIVKHVGSTDKIPELQSSRKVSDQDSEESELSEISTKTLERKGFAVKEKLGQGSFGAVYLCSSKDKPDAAMKIVDKSKIKPEVYDKFFSREVDLIKTLKAHPNIIEFYTIFEDPSNYYIAMEYAPNGDLFEYVKKRRFIPEFVSHYWFVQLTEGIDFCHQSGYAHRDIKCENLLLDVKFDLKLSDFGFACKLIKKKSEDEGLSLSASSLEALSKTFCGSYLYACPELLAQSAYDPRKSGKL